MILLTEHETGEAFFINETYILGIGEHDGVTIIKLISDEEVSVSENMYSVVAKIEDNQNPPQPKASSLEI